MKCYKFLNLQNSNSLLKDASPIILKLQKGLNKNESKKKETLVYEKQLVFVNSLFDCVSEMKLKHLQQSNY